MRELGICVICKGRKKTPYKFNDGRLCRVCYKSKVNGKECYICHRIRAVQINTEKGPVCNSCSKSEKAKFIQKFIDLPLEEAALVIAHGITERDKKFLKKMNYLKEAKENRKKLREIFCLMNKFPSGQRILANFLRTEEGEQFSQIICQIIY